MQIFWIVSANFKLIDYDRLKIELFCSITFDSFSLSSIVVRNDSEQN